MLRIDENYLFVIIGYFLIYITEILILHSFIRVIDCENIQYNNETISRKLSYQMIQMYSEDLSGKEK